MTANQYLLVYDLLLEKNYDITSIYLSNSYNYDLIYVQIYFDEFVKFKEYVKESLDIDICTFWGTLNLYITHDKLKRLPNNVLDLGINYKFSDTNTGNDFINLDILNYIPATLKRLFLSSNGKNNTIYINNLPNIIYIQLKDIKFNFDYLPENIKVLEIIFKNMKPSYILDDFENLPNSLEKIIIGEKKYYSVKELVNSFV